MKHPTKKQQFKRVSFRKLMPSGHSYLDEGLVDCRGALKVFRDEDEDLGRMLMTRGVLYLGIGFTILRDCVYKAKFSAMGGGK
jgi:hypothetical protein